MRRSRIHSRPFENLSPNLLRFSEQFDNAVWSPGTGGVVAANSVVAPDGNTTADAYTYATSTGSFAYLSQQMNGGQDATALYTFSVWLKVPSGTAPIRLAISDVTTITTNGPVLTVTNTWQRFSFSYAGTSVLHNTGAIGVGLLGGTPGQVYHVWGAQLNAGNISLYQQKT